MDIKKHVGWIIDKYVDVRGKDLIVDGVVHHLEYLNEEVGVAEHNGQTIFMVLGSNDFKDWVQNFMFRTRVVPYNGNNKKLKVHNGFYKAYYSIRSKIQMYVKHNDIKSVIVMGQSHGAAVATLMALDIQYNFPETEVACMLTGSPRVGNKVFVESYNRRVPNTMLFRYGNDPVARIPFKFMGYKHVSKEIAINKTKKFKFMAVKDHMLNKTKAAEYLALYPEV